MAIPIARYQAVIPEGLTQPTLILPIQHAIPATSFGMCSEVPTIARLHRSLQVHKVLQEIRPAAVQAVAALLLLKESLDTNPISHQEFCGLMQPELIPLAMMCFLLLNNTSNRL